MQSERDAEQEIEFYSWQTQYGHEEARIAAEERALAKHKSNSKYKYGRTNYGCKLYWEAETYGSRIQC